jgi:hypothetical protein
VKVIPEVKFGQSVSGRARFPLVEVTSGMNAADVTSSGP